MAHIFKSVTANAFCISGWITHPPYPARSPPLYPGAGLYETKEVNATDETDSILETKTTLLLIL